MTSKTEELMLERLASLEERVRAAVRIAAHYGGTDGAHHKTWVIDQMVRELLGDKAYPAWIGINFSESGWDKGIAP